MHKNLIVALLLAMITGQAYATDIVVDCRVTTSKEDADKSMPDKIGFTNNLRRKTGSPLLAEGAPIIFKGVITDSACVPISDVLISIWHKDHNGHYSADKEVDANFVGSGSATTDNTGAYEFLSILPYAEEGKQPIIHVQIEHEDYDPIYADIALGGKDGLVAESEPYSLQDPDAATIYKFNFSFSKQDETRTF